MVSSIDGFNTTTPIGLLKAAGLNSLNDITSLGPTTAYDASSNVYSSVYTQNTPKKSQLERAQEMRIAQRKAERQVAAKSVAEPVTNLCGADVVTPTQRVGAAVTVPVAPDAGRTEALIAKAAPAPMDLNTESITSGSHFALQAQNGLIRPIPEAEMMRPSSTAPAQEMEPAAFGQTTEPTWFATEPTPLTFPGAVEPQYFVPVADPYASSIAVEPYSYVAEPVLDAPLAVPVEMNFQPQERANEATPAAKIENRARTLNELVPSMRRPTYTADETGPVMAARLDNRASSPPVAIRLDADALKPEIKSVPETRIDFSRRDDASPAVSDSARRLSVIDVSDYTQRPEYKQFSQDNMPFSENHSFNLDGSSVTRTAMEGHYRLWSLETATMLDGTKRETLRCPMGKERCHIENIGDHWTLTETYYDSQGGRESLWRSRVRVSSSDGTQAVHYYNNGREITSEKQKLV